jgi:hypothetical protein
MPVDEQDRYPSLQLGTDGSSQSHTSSGIMLPGERSPAKVFAKLFWLVLPKNATQKTNDCRRNAVF